MNPDDALDARPARIRIPSLAVLLALLALPLAAARQPEPAAEIEAGAGLFTFTPNLAYAQVRVTVSGPDGFEVVKTFSAGEAPIVGLPGTDGLYKYELRFSPVRSVEERELLAAARAAGTRITPVADAAERRVQNGSFRVADGSVVADLEEPRADKVVLSNADGVIRNSLCVGFDCPNSPNFDDSPILLMENNNRIKFGDTSNAPYPANDWEIEANSSSSGGTSYLGFNDCGTADNDGGCTTDLVFAVEAGARASALYVDSYGDVGVGTANPGANVHVVSSDSPSLRLDQDGSASFDPQVWEIAGNEVSFFVRDVSNGSTLPLRIRPGAPSSAIDIAANGDVGIGDATPDASLNVSRGNGTAQILVEELSAAESTRDLIRIENKGTTRIAMEDTSADGEEWQLAVNGAANAFVITNEGSGATELTLVRANTGAANAGDLTIVGDIFTGGGTCGGGCDALFQGDVESIADHAAYMFEHSHLPGVGPTSPDAPWNLTEKTGGILNELEKAHIYIVELDGTVAELGRGLELRNAQIEHLSRDLEAKEARIAQLEQALARIEALIESR
jgi:hypothetical protein